MRFNTSRAAWLFGCVLAPLFAFAADPAPSTRPAEIEKVTVFDPKVEGYASCRIPGIVATSRGTLLAYCEARRGKGGDWDAIDLLLRRSTDGGRTWSTTQRLAGQGDATCNNPAAIVDRERGAVHFVYCVGYARCYYRRSDDDGQTFSEPVDVTSTFDEFKHDYAWNVIASGPTHGIQLQRGRLLVPVWLSTGGRTHHPSVVATIYSDDHGKTWRRGAIAIPSTPDVRDPNETVAVEVSDGRVMLNARNESARQRRVFVTGPDGAGGWTAPAFDEQLVEPICNASMLRIAVGGGAPAIIFANPKNDGDPNEKSKAPGRAIGRKRRNLTLRLSRDDGRSWTAERTIEPGPSGYSDLAMAADGAVCCVYERDGGLVLARVALGQMNAVTR